jgi:hypothetical protein
MFMKKMQPKEKEERRKAMMAVVGMWKNRRDLSDSETYVRRLRRDTRFERLWKE